MMAEAKRLMEDNERMRMETQSEDDSLRKEVASLKRKYSGTLKLREGRHVVFVPSGLLVFSDCKDYALPQQRKRRRILQNLTILVLSCWTNPSPAMSRSKCSLVRTRVCLLDDETPPLALMLHEGRDTADG